MGCLEREDAVEHWITEDGGGKRCSESFHLINAVDYLLLVPFAEQFPIEYSKEEAEENVEIGSFNSDQELINNAKDIQRNFNI